MQQSKVILLATLATKKDETEYLSAQMESHGVEVLLVDLSLATNGRILGGADKIEAMELAALKATSIIAEMIDLGVNAVIGLGGGTGGEIALRVLRALPITFPKVLVSTLPFDPRIAVADSSIIMVPTLADIVGLNATLREVLENAAALTAGVCQTRRTAGACVQETSIGITALGATDGAVGQLVCALRDDNRESTVFHSNGYGGAAFTRFIKRGAFHTLIDLTPHELTRIHVAGAHVPLEERFSAGHDIPRVVLPGGLNFIGLGEKSLMPQRYLDRPHYEHSGLFTHAKLTEDEMADVSRRLAHSLNAHSAPVTVIMPMGGFSHQDCPGGAIEDAALREVCLETLRAEVRDDIPVTAYPWHISAPEITDKILAAIDTVHSH